MSKKRDRCLSYTFRPFDLTKVIYKCYDGLFDRGINAYPKPRSGHRIVCNDSEIFLFGGFNPATARSANTMLFQEMWRFDKFTKKWKLWFGPRDECEQLPTELASNAMALENDMMVIYGGTGYPFGMTCSNKTFIYQPYNAPKTIQNLNSSGDMPTPQYGQAMLVRGPHIYVIGGTTGFEYSCDVHRLDLRTNEWESITYSRAENEDDPTGRYRHELAQDAEHIYIIGGGTSHEAFSLESLHAFHIKSRKWIKRPTLPDPLVPSHGFPGPRRCHSCIQYQTLSGQTEIVITGGFFEDEMFYDDIWSLNLSTMQWRLFKAELPHPMYFHDAATSGNGLMYLFGGIEAQDNGQLRTNNLYKIWVMVPKLSEISWEACLTIHPRLPLCSAESLRRLGVPERFVSRLHRASNAVSS